jgi:preprotein translocase subunit YajC
VNSAILIWIALLVVGFYFLIVRPQRTQRARSRNMQRSIGVGDQVVTIGGMYGEVMAIDDDEVRLEVAPDVTLRFARRAIAGKVAEATEATEATEEEVAEEEPEVEEEAVEAPPETVAQASVGEDDPAERR